MPDGALLKAVSNGSILVDGKLKWQQAGRDPKLLTCDFRNYDMDVAPLSSWEEAKAHWFRMFYRFVDGTYLRECAPYVDAVEENNEYFANSTWTNPNDAKRCIQSAQAAVSVWNESFRGRTVHSPDGGIGDIPAHCRLVIGNGPVGNLTPREYYLLARDSDSILGAHPYTKWVNKQRAVNDWQDNSGLWALEEQQYGVKVRFLFSECTPFDGTSAGGWRAQTCLGGDVALLEYAMRQWWADIAQTPAYQEGRIVGPGAFFTTGGQGWPFYELDAPPLAVLANAARDMWRPGTGDDMDTTKIRQHAQAIIYNVDDVWWLKQPPVFKTAAPNKVLVFRNAAAAPLSPNPRPNPITYQLDVFEVNDMLALLRVTDFKGAQPDWYVRAGDVSAA